MNHTDYRALLGLGSLGEREALRTYVQRLFSRIVAHGVDYDVAHRVTGRIDTFDAWAPQWAAEGDRWKALAAAARRRGHKTTARDAYFLASNCYRVAQHILHDDSEKMAYYPKVMKLYETAGKLMDPPMKALSFRSPHGKLPAYLAFPPGRGKFPAAILAGGADGWREEYAPVTRALLERGLAVLNVDAPGQGAARLLRKKFMPVDVEKAYSAAIDFLLKQPAVHPRKIFMVGHSVGGYLTLRTAATDKRLAACATLGAPFELLTIFASSPPSRRINFSLMCGAADPERGKELLRPFTLEGLLGNVSCPILMIHGKKDSVIPPSHVERIQGALQNPAALRTWEDGVHCCDNHVGETYPLIGDWLREQAGKRS